MHDGSLADASPDDSFTLDFGQQPNGRANFLHVMEGWSHNAPLYKPRRKARDREWKVPVSQPIV